VAAGLFALLVLAYLWPALLGGELLSPVGALYAVPPWASAVPSGLAGHVNGVLTDVAQGHYPWNVYARELIHEGTFPAWNPHALAGVPFFANPQTALLSPFSLPIWVLPLNYGIGVSAALKLWAAAFGTYLLVRELRLGFLPGMLAGVAFAFCAFNVVWLTHETLPGVSVMLPWTLWLVERLLRRGGLGAAIGLTVATAIAVTGGHPGTQVHLLAATGLYAVVRGATLPDLARALLVRRLALAGGAVVLGILLVAVIFVPEIRSSHGTLGTHARVGGGGGEPGTRMPLAAIRTTLFPDWWGRPSAYEADTALVVAAGEGSYVHVNFNERTFYEGIVALLLACVALVSRRGWRRKAPFAVLAALALAIPLDAPGLHWLVERLPIFDVIQNQRMIFVFELAIAVLAAFGLQELLDRPRGDRRRFAVVGGALAVGLLAAITAGASGADLGHTVRHFVTGADFQAGRVLALTSVVWFLLFALGLGVALLAARRWPRRVAAIATGLVLLAVGDMLHFVHGYQPMAPASVLVPPRTPAIAYLQRHAREGRLVGIESAFVNDASVLYGLDDVRGYDPPQPTLRFFRLWREASPGQPGWMSLSFAGVTDAVVHVASVLGARYFVGGPGEQLRSGGGGSVDALRRVYAGPDATVFSNALAVPRAMVAPAVQITAGESATRAALLASAFDPRQVAVVERDQPGVATLGRGSVAGSATVARETNSSVTVAATLSRRGLVVLNDDFTDGWSVTVDGRAAPALHVNDVMRGVIAGPGRHTVVWRYRVPGLRLGAILSACALVLLIAACIVRLRQARRQPLRV
jgi:hypothetical protein